MTMTLVDEAKERHANCRRNIALLIQQCRITQRDLARATGLAAQTVHERLAGRTDLRAYELEAVARAFGVDEELLKQSSNEVMRWLREHPEVLLKWSPALGETQSGCIHVRPRHRVAA